MSLKQHHKSDNLKLSQEFISSKTLFLVNLNNRYAKELNNFYESCKKKNDDKINKLLYEDWRKSHVSWDTWAIKELFISTNSLEDLKRIGDEDSSKFREWLIEKVEEIDNDELNDWYSEYLNEADSKIFEEIYLKCVNDQELKRIKQFVIREIKKLDLIKFREHCWRYFDTVEESHQTRLFKLIHGFTLSNKDWEEYIDTLESKNLDILELRKEFLKRLSDLDLKDLKQLVFEILNFLDLKSIKQFYFSDVKNVSPEKLKQIFLNKLNNFDSKNKKFNDEGLESIFYKIKSFSKIAQELNDFHNSFLIYKADEDELKNIISLIYKANKDTEPFLIFIKWCLDRIDKNSSKEELEYVKDFYMQLSKEATSMELNEEITNKEQETIKQKVIRYFSNLISSD